MFLWAEVFVAAVVALIIIWEILIPGMRGTPFFPFLYRGRKATLESDRQRAVAAIEDALLEKEVKQLAEQAEKEKSEGKKA